jgi:hypothetical protein
MSRSLYERYGVVAAGPRPGPGTIHTAQVETVDNDLAGMHGEVLGFVSGDSLELVEVEAGKTDRQCSGTSDPRPRPGSAYTATIETTDEDAAGGLCQMSVEWVVQQRF